MLRLNPNNIEAFLDKYSTKLMIGIVHYIPSIVVEETDDISEFVNRILYTARQNGCFNRTFGHKSESLYIDDSDIDAYVINILSSSIDVPLRRRIMEPHVFITPNGDFKPFTAEVPQPSISWKRKGEEFQCVLKYTNGDIEKIQSWPI